MSVRILIGDVRDKLRELPADHFDCVVTSPPYWGLRDYGTARWEGGDPSCQHRSPTMREGREEQRSALAGSAATNSAQLLLAHRSACGKCGAVKVDAQIGLEPTLAEHLSVMVGVMREVRRVLKPTGTLWLNYGDCYATAPNGRSAADTKSLSNDDRTFRDKPFSTVGGALKAKDLCMVPNRLAIALQEDGWWVRSEIIWAKPNPMPESIKDRPATAHEKIFLLSKCARYHYDADAVRQTGSPDSIDRYHRGRSDDHKWSDGGPGGQSIAKSFDATAAKHPRKKADRQQDIADSSPGSSSRRMAGFNDRWNDKVRASDVASPQHAGHINHTGIEETARGAGRSLRNYEPAPMQVWEMATRPFSDAHFATFPPELAERCLRAGCPAGGNVLDPFGGAGTTALVADRFGLDCTLIELNPDYAEIARKRISGDAGMFSSVEVAA